MNSYRKRSFSQSTNSKANEIKQKKSTLQCLCDLTIADAPFSIQDCFVDQKTPRVAFLDAAFVWKGLYADPKIAYRGYFRQRVMSDVWHDACVQKKNFIALRVTSASLEYCIVYKILEKKGQCLDGWIKSIDAKKMLFDINGSVRILQSCFLHLIFRFVLGVNDFSKEDETQNNALSHIIVTPTILSCSGISYFNDSGQKELLGKDSHLEKSKTCSALLDADKWHNEAAENIFSMILSGNIGRQLKSSLQKCNGYANWQRIADLVEEHCIYDTQSEMQTYVESMKKRLQAIINSIKIA